MKKLLALTGLLVPLAIFSAACGQSHADTTDQAFVRALSSQGIYSTQGPAGLIVVGHEICNDLDMGTTPYLEAQRLYNVSTLGMSTHQAGFMVGAAIGAYCPQYSSEIG